jgi:hypothetical protein
LPLPLPLLPLLLLPLLLFLLLDGGMLLESDACFACCKALGRCLVELPSGISDISLEGKTDSGTPISDPISRGKFSTSKFRYRHIKYRLKYKNNQQQHVFLIICCNTWGYSAINCIST